MKLIKVLVLALALGGFLAAASGCSGAGKQELYSKKEFSGTTKTVEEPSPD